MARAAVGDRWLIRVEFDDRVIDAVAGERSQHMLHGLDFGVPLRQRCVPIRLRHIFNLRFDLRFAVQVHAAEADAGIRRSGHKRHVHAVSAVQPHPSVPHRLSQCLLLQHRAVIYARPRGLWQAPAPKTLAAIPAVGGTSYTSPLREDHSLRVRGTNLMAR